MADERQHLGTVTEAPVTAAEGATVLDNAARSRLGISGAEFLHRWDHGDYADLDHVTVMEVAQFIPLAR